MKNLLKKIIVCIIGGILLNAVIAPAITTITALRSLVGVVPAFTDTIDTAKPAGTDDPSEADDNMRRIQAGFQEILAVEHNVDLTGTEITGDGKHTAITCDSVTSAGAISGTTITGSGAISGTSITGSTTLGITGNGTIGGTLDVTGVATVAKGSLLASSDAPTTDAMISNKKYVDDEVANSVAASAAKAWCQVESDGTLKAGSHNITSCVRNEEGVYTITWDTNFANTLYVPIVTPISTQNVAKQGWASSLGGGSCVVTMTNAAGTRLDTAFSVTAFGTQ